MTFCLVRASYFAFDVMALAKVENRRNNAPNYVKEDALPSDHVRHQINFVLYLQRVTCQYALSIHAPSSAIYKTKIEVITILLMTVFVAPNVQLLTASGMFFLRTTQILFHVLSLICFILSKLHPYSCWSP